MKPRLLKKAFRNTSALPTTPSAPLRWLRLFFLMAQPPSYVRRGIASLNIRSTAPLTFGSQLYRPHLQWLRTSFLRKLSSLGRLKKNGKFAKNKSMSKPDSPFTSFDGRVLHDADFRDVEFV